MPLRPKILLIALAALAALATPIAFAQSNSFTLTTLVNFTGTNGAVPVSNLIQASDGNYYGTTLHGGANGFGTIYQLTPAGALTTIHSFAGPDGRYPYASLIQGADGNLYGTTTEGGALEQGTVFRISPGGPLTTLHSFSGPDGNSPYANLIQATDGNFYGTTTGGGPNQSGFGSLFRMTPTGIVTPIYSFLGGTDGYFPYNSLLQASDGNLYGVTSTGSNDDNGAVFQSTLDGHFTPIVIVAPTGSISAYTSLDQNSSEELVGTTSSGGATGHGEIFTLSPNGALTDVYDFPTTGDGGIPIAGLLLATDGNQYGSAYGYFTDGGLFSYSPAGEFQTIEVFTANTGQLPFDSLMQGSDGNFYGNTSAGGTGSDGVLFRLAPSTPLPAPVQLTFNPATVPAGTAAQLSWQVINAYSATLQQCNAFISGNPAGAGTWTGPQRGQLNGEYYTGSASIVPTEPGQYTYALTCGGVESGLATLTVTGAAKLPTLTTLTASAATLNQGQPITLTARMSTTLKKGTHPTPTGTITFRYGQQTIAGIPISSTGEAALSGSSAAIPAGNYILSATYSGDTNYAPSNSATLPINLRAQTSLALTVTPATIPSGATATLLAVVTEKSGPQLPTGIVTFYYQGRALGQSNLLDAQATWVQSTQGLPAGTYQLTAIYAGDASNAPSTAELFVTVTE
jgi:uncharacterized repeat protein (TIGR03803 family)